MTTQLNFFNGINEFEVLKREYLREIKKNHPDLHPEDREKYNKITQEINDAYDLQFKKINGYINNDHAIDIKQYKNIIDKLIKCNGLTIEIIGTWIWVTGNTKENKEVLKELKFRWHAKKLAWYKPDENSKYKKSYGNTTLEDIKISHGLLYSVNSKTNKAIA